MNLTIIRDFINMPDEKAVIENMIDSGDYKKALKYIEDLLAYSGEDLWFLQVYMGEILYLQGYPEQACNLWDISLCKLDDLPKNEGYWHALYRIYRLICSLSKKESAISKELLSTTRDIVASIM